MDTEIINNKIFTKPSFFWISNLGGGGSDKYREIVYLDLYDGIPTLYNYYYLKYPSFATKWLNNIDEYKSFGDFLKYTRESMIYEEHFITEEHIPGSYNYKDNIYLLDSGARNILNDIIRGKIKLIEDIETTMKHEMFKYYDFAERLKFDFIIGYDIGGKYTFKDNETRDNRIINQMKKIDSINLNNELLIETIKYLKDKKYYPRIYATVHGDTPDEYEESIKFIRKAEKEYGFEFYGYALGGVASAKKVDDSWFKDFNNNSLKNEYLVTKALKIVKKYSGDKPIHVLGGGNKDNIPSLVINGATSFDCQSPARRAYDGNESSSALIFNINARESFSKYLPGLLENDRMINTKGLIDYIKINAVDNDTPLCNCPACKKINNILELKKLYSRKNESNEYYYYSRQIMNSHAIWQHFYLTKIVANCNTFEELLNKYPADFIVCLSDLFE